jgi:IS5 family transposase
LSIPQARRSPEDRSPRCHGIKNPAKNRQKDKDARWTKKHGKSFFGYKNHINADAKHKLIRQYAVTDASVHDSRKFDRLIARPTVLDRSALA